MGSWQSKGVVKTSTPRYEKLHILYLTLAVEARTHLKEDKIVSSLLNERGSRIFRSNARKYAPAHVAHCVIQYLEEVKRHAVLTATQKNT